VVGALRPTPSSSFTPVTVEALIDLLAAVASACAAVACAAACAAVNAATVLGVAQSDGPVP